ncbi:MAG: hypothetical protein HY720_28160 [Planctomycetes bacterium]|nr:hypothetical protein [Planctomycetota bacterium]
MSPLERASFVAVLALTVSGALLADDSPPVPLEGLAQADRAEVERIHGQPTLTCPLEKKDVAATVEIYEFLLDRLDFTGRIVRRFRMGDYEITAMGADAFHIDDGDGAVADARLLYQGPQGEGWTRRLYLAKGFFEILGSVRIYGDALIVLDYRAREERVLETVATIDFKARNDTLDRLGRAAEKALRVVVAKKAALFITAAKDASELVLSGASRVDERLRDDPDVRRDQLEEFRAAFLE